MLEDLQIRPYSPTTIRIYLRCIAEFAQHFGKPPDRLSAEHIRQYQLFLIKEKKVSLPTYIQMVCALRFFYTHTLNQKVAPGFRTRNASRIACSLSGKNMMPNWQAIASND